MDVARLSGSLLEMEARGLLARLDQIRPLALHETMVPAAALPPRASLEVERFLHRAPAAAAAGPRVPGLAGGPGRTASPAEQQYRFVLIRLRFNAILSQFDMFTEVSPSAARAGPASGWPGWTCWRRTRSP